MEIILNGEKYSTEENTTIEGVLSSMGETLPKLFVVEYNGNIVYKEDYKKHTLKDKDNLEIAMFTGGG